MESVESMLLRANKVPWRARIDECHGGHPGTRIVVSAGHYDDLAAGRAKILGQKCRDVDFRTVHRNKRRRIEQRSWIVMYTVPSLLAMLWPEMKPTYVPRCVNAVLQAPRLWFPLPLHHLKGHREDRVSVQVVCQYSRGLAWMRLR